MFCTTSRPTPRPEISVTVSLSVKPGRNRNSSSSASVSFSATAGVASFRFRMASRTRSSWTPAPSSVTVTSSMPALWRASRRMVPSAGFAGALALLGRFAAVIHGVAQQVRQRAFQPLQDVAVHLGIFADDFEPHLLAQGAGQVAHHARETANAIAEGPHARAQHFQIHALRKVRGAAVEHVQFLHAIGQKLLAASATLRDSSLNCSSARSDRFASARALAQVHPALPTAPSAGV